MNEMIERAARKLAAKHYALRFAKPEDDKHVLLNVDANWHTFDPTVREVVKAIREPTEAMIEAGKFAYIHGSADSYRAMIDEILK